MGGQPPAHVTAAVAAPLVTWQRPAARPREVLPIRLMPLLGAERGQRLRPRRRALRFGLLQSDHRLGLHRRAQAGGILDRIEQVRQTMDPDRPVEKRKIQPTASFAALGDSR